MNFQPGAVPPAIQFLGLLNHKVQGRAGHGPIIAFKAELPACVVNEKIHSASFVTRRQLQLTRQRRPIVLRIENALARPRRALRIVHWTRCPSFGKMTVTTHIMKPDKGGASSCLKLSKKGGVSKWQKAYALSSSA